MKQRFATPEVGIHCRHLGPSSQLNDVVFRPRQQQQQQSRQPNVQPIGHLFRHPPHHQPPATRPYHPPPAPPPPQMNPNATRHHHPVHHHLQQPNISPLSIGAMMGSRGSLPETVVASVPSQLEPAQEKSARTSHAKASVMEKYESLGMVGEGSYGMVLKCRHRESGQLVAVKKFIESEDDKMVKKIAMREIRMLKQLRHDNLVNLIEVFRRKKRLYLVFEFMDHTVLDDLDRCPGGLDEDRVKRISFQVLRGIEFCHLHNIIHRDIKPENILVSKSGVVKMCDFGFARTLAKPGEAYTDYVATRWYRAPELLVGDTNYGRAVDIWAIGCLFGELLTAEPLFPGESDIDQLFHIIKCFGNLTARHQEVFHRNPLFDRLRLPVVSEVEPLDKRYARLTPTAVDFMKRCLQLDADERPTCSQLLKHDFFTVNHFAQKFSRELQSIVQREHRNNPLLSKVRISTKGPADRSPDREGTRGATKGATGLPQTLCNSGSEEGERPDDEKISEKPKRKLPDVEKISRSSPINNNNHRHPHNGPSPPTHHPQPHHPPPPPSETQHAASSSSSSSWPQQERHHLVHDHEDLQSLVTRKQPIQAPPGNPLERLSEKSKPHAKKSNQNAVKKGSNFTNHHHYNHHQPNHHHTNGNHHFSRSLVASQTTVAQAVGQLPDHEQFSVVAKSKNTNPKGQSMEKVDGRFHLPNVRSNEASSPARVLCKTNNLSMTSMPQITNFDPIVGETNFKDGWTPVERNRSSSEDDLRYEDSLPVENRRTPEHSTTNFPSVLNLN